MGRPTDEWIVDSRRVDPGRFAAGRLGPYRLSTRTEATDFGEIVIGVHPRVAEVLEIELLTTCSDDSTDPHVALMADLAEIAWLEHPHLPRIVGSGVQGGVPYVVRRHHLGRSLEQVLVEAGGFDRSSAPSVLHSVTQTIAFLGDQGAAPGACAMGGFTVRDVFLGFDGKVELRGVGLQALRASEDPVDDDVRSCLCLARVLDEVTGLGLSSVIEDADTPAAMARKLRVRFSAEVRAGRFELSRFLRGALERRLGEDREFFGLKPLQ